MNLPQTAAILGCEGTVLSASERAFFAQANPWGFILFARNIEGPDQLRRLTDQLRDAVGRDAPVAIDQEGGRVQRMGPPHWRQWQPALDQVTQAPKGRAARIMALRMQIIAADLRAVGIDMNCAPLADVATAQTHPVLRNRCYGSTVETVVEVARAVAEGLLAGGVLPVLKHIPGHGRATVDSHLEPPRVTATHADLAQTDFAAFRGVADCPVGMTGHMMFDAIDPGVPTTASSKMITLIRDEIGFGGVLMTDDISMEALSGSVGHRTAAAIAAGCDLVLHCNGDRDQMEAVVAAAGSMTQAAQSRAAAALSRRTPPADVDIAALDAEFMALTKA